MSVRCQDPAWLGLGQDLEEKAKVHFQWNCSHRRRRWTPLLSKRLFALNEEPNGERVNTYHKIKRTAYILEALDDEEIEFLRNSPFGKIIANYDNPPFSGAFGYTVIVRRLKTKKKYEIWFLFAGNPIRFSLREFAIVTGLNCGQISNSVKRKRKNTLKEKLYWNELFGSFKTSSTEMVVEMLKKKVVKDKETRINFACLAITASVLLASSHNPKIIPEHAELIRDLKEFMDYPWGRVSFQHLLTNLLKKDEIALSQDSVAIQGYVDLIQLVMIAAVPNLKEEVTPPGPPPVVDYQSEGENAPDEDSAIVSPQDAAPATPNPNPRFFIIPGHAKAMDAEAKVKETNILQEPGEERLSGADFSWKDACVDPEVGSMVQLIEEGFTFRKEFFTGGTTAQELARMKLEKQREKDMKHEKDNADESGDGDSSERSSRVPFASLVSAELKNQLGGLEGRLAHVIEAQVKKCVAEMGVRC
ncbi:hypothetical protein Bca101_019871 [Brassica carinata]